MTQLPRQSSVERCWIEVDLTLHHRVDVADHLERGRSYTPEELAELAAGVLEYHECALGDEVECDGYAMRPRAPAEGLHPCEQCGDVIGGEPAVEFPYCGPCLASKLSVLG